MVPTINGGKDSQVQATAFQKPIGLGRLPSDRMK